MIVDSSALVAIVKDEDDAERFAAALARASRARMSAANWAEAAVVVDSIRSAESSRRFDQLVASVPIDVTPLTAEQAQIARQAYRDFGRGSGHPAGLNFGDCFAYALAIDADEPLLFKGEAFTRTDVRPA